MNDLEVPTLAEKRARKALVTRYSCRPDFLVHRLLRVLFRLHGFSTADLLPLPRISPLRRGLDPRVLFLALSHRSSGSRVRMG